jgi:hypothetical protein
MKLNKWAIRWGVSHDALEDLRKQLGTVEHGHSEQSGISEAAIQSHVMLEASRKNIWLFRNNVGAAKTSTGRVIRYGLSNDSERQNKLFKSSDLIGVRPVVITPPMVGSTIGQFVAREIKAPDWRYTATNREKAQLNFINGLVARGADAMFANHVGTL